MRKNVKKSQMEWVIMIVELSLLTALEVVLSRFLSYSVWNMKIGFAFIPVALAGVLYGPIAGAVVGGLSDFLGAILFPIGAYFPGFTLTAALVGACFGLFLNGNLFNKMNKFVCVILAVVINQVIGSFILNTVWISVLYGTPIRELFVTRIIQNSIMIPVELVIVPVIIKLAELLNKSVRKFAVKSKR